MLPWRALLLGAVYAAEVAAAVNVTGYEPPETVEGALFWEPFISLWGRWVRPAAAWPVALVQSPQSAREPRPPFSCICFPPLSVPFPSLRRP
eukprot:scaffold2684_cov124-Isochrysis_galbana.AAC.3